MKYAWVLLLVILVGCQNDVVDFVKTPLWVVSTETDTFTDVVTRIVTIGSFSSHGFTYTEVGKLYPFAGIKNGQVYVGVRSGGNYKVPTGTVQIRIDDNAAWTITPDETPADLVPGTAVAPGANKDVPASMMESMAKIMSPYTAATGQKAQDIIKQMAQGKIMRWRQVGLNQAGTTGEVKIDESFTESLQSIGINPDRL